MILNGQIFKVTSGKISFIHRLETGWFFSEVRSIVVLFRIDRLKNCGVAANLCSLNLITYSQREPATEHFLSPFFSNICFTASIIWVFGVERFHFGLAFKVRRARGKIELGQSLIKTRVGRNMPQNLNPWHQKPEFTSILICLVQTTSSGRLNHELLLQSSSRQLLIWLLPLRLKEPAFVQLKKTNLANVWVLFSFSDPSLRFHSSGTNNSGSHESSRTV